MKFLRRSGPSAPTRMPDTLDNAVARIAEADSAGALVQVLVDVTRTVIGSEGITVVRRSGDTVTYVGEDAISPLWTGESFPIRLCVSGLAMLARAPIVIPDIASDRRVPLNAYVATFVRSMVIVPIGRDDPQWAIGAYWHAAQPIAPIAVERMTRLADAASGSLTRMAGTDATGRQVA